MDLLILPPLCCVGEGEESEDGNDAVEAVMREAGLHSSSESDGEEPAERPSKRARKSQNGGTQEDGQANRAGRGSRAGGARKEEEGGGDEFGYDYCAARAAAPGLDLGLNGQVGKQARGEYPHCASSWSAYANMNILITSSPLFSSPLYHDTDLQSIMPLNEGQECDAEICNHVRKGGTVYQRCQLHRSNFRYPGGRKSVLPNLAAIP